MLLYNMVCNNMCMIVDPHMFLLCNSERCDNYGTVFHEYHVNDLRTTKCSGMLGHRSIPP